MAREFFRSALTASDLIGSDTVAVIAGQFVKLGEYQVPAGEELAIGYGPHTSQESAVGRFYAKIMDDTATAVEEPGVIRLTAYSPQDRPLRVLAEFRTEQANQGENDVTLRIPMPESIYNLREDQKLVLEFKSDASDNVVKASSVIILDVTKYVV